MTLYFCAVVCAIRSQCVLFGLESPRQGETHPSNRWMEDLYDQLWSFHCRSWTDSLLSMYTKHHNLILVRAWKDGSESGCIGCKFLWKQGTRRCEGRQNPFVCHSSNRSWWWNPACFFDTLTLTNTRSTSSLFQKISWFCGIQFHFQIFWIFGNDFEYLVKNH